MHHSTARPSSATTLLLSCFPGRFDFDVSATGIWDHTQHVEDDQRLRASGGNMFVRCVVRAEVA